MKALYKYNNATNISSMRQHMGYGTSMTSTSSRKRSMNTQYL